MEKTSPRARHLLSRMVLSLLALVILLPVVMTAIYSFFSPAEIKAFMGTRGSYDADAFMQIKLAPSMFSLSQYYNILIEDMTILRYFVNSAMYAAAILLGQEETARLLLDAGAVCDFSRPSQLRVLRQGSEETLRIADVLPGVGFEKIPKAEREALRLAVTQDRRRRAFWAELELEAP